ncbi:Uncharacterised protein [uncultured archaeon]|nr:Uncharacterised protein [uncultured archaeon]
MLFLLKPSIIPSESGLKYAVVKGKHALSAPEVISLSDASLSSCIGITDFIASAIRMKGIFGIIIIELSSETAFCVSSSSFSLPNALTLTYNEIPKSFSSPFCRLSSTFSVSSRCILSEGLTMPFICAAIRSDSCFTSSWLSFVSVASMFEGRMCMLRSKLPSLDTIRSSHPSFMVRGYPTANTVLHSSLFIWKQSNSLRMRDGLSRPCRVVMEITQWL